MFGIYNQIKELLFILFEYSIINLINMFLKNLFRKSQEPNPEVKS
jgi:hypothetical protein